MILGVTVVAATGIAVAATQGPDWNPLILALAATIVILNGLLPSVVSVLLHRTSSRRQRAQSEQLDVIHQDTNGNLSALRAEVVRLRAEVVKLSGVAQNAAFGPVGEDDRHAPS